MADSAPAFVRLNSDGTVDDSRVVFDTTAVDTPTLLAGQSWISTDDTTASAAIEARNARANAPSLASIKAWAQAVLDKTDCKMLADTPYPSDMPTWIPIRAACRALLRLPDTTDTSAVTLPALPFPLTGLPTLTR
jgi:hypothetical protein